MAPRGLIDLPSVAGETGPDLSATLLRTLLRSVAFALASVAVLAVLYSFGLVDLGRIADAFRRRWDLLAANVVCILAVAVIAVARNAWALRVLGAPIPLARVAGANLVSQGLGQWAPGSIVVTEGLRIGILMGARAADRPNASTLARIGVASLGDRLIGLGVCFVVGGVATLALSLGRPAATPALLYLLACAYLAVGAMLSALPLAGDTAPIRWLASLLAKPGGPRLAARLTGTFASALRLGGDSSADWRRNRRFVVTYLLAALAAVLNAAQLALASGETGGAIPWPVLMAAYPATYAGVILPLGFAGFGAPQLVAAAVFAAFGVAARAVIAMSLFQTTLLLAAQTLLGVGWAALRGDEVVRAFGRAGAGRQA